MNKDEPASFDQCLGDYLEQNGSEKITSYMGLSERKIKYFLKKPPKGQQFIRLAMFLDNEGYSVREIENLPHELYDLAKVILAGHIDYRGLQLKYPDIFTYGRDHVSDMFRRPHRFGQGMYGKARGIYEEWKALYPELEKFPIEAGPLKETPKAPRTRGPKSKAIQVKSSKTETNGIHEAIDLKQTMLSGFASLVDAAMPLGQAILSDQFTSEDRYTLRVNLLAEGKLTKFADMINSLVSEHARQKKNS